MVVQQVEIQISHPVVFDKGLKYAEESAQSLITFLSTINVESGLSEVGADTVAKRAFLSKQVNMQRMSNNPVGLTDAQISQIFDL